MCKLLLPRWRALRCKDTEVFLSFSSQQLLNYLTLGVAQNHQARVSSLRQSIRVIINEKLRKFNSIYNQGYIH